MKTQLFILLSFCLSLVIPSYAKIIYVDDDATAGGDGSSWGNAYKHLQDALQEPPVAGDEIWVGQGTYRPDEISVDPNGTDDREATFQLVNGVALKGGYAGVGEVDPDVRDWELYETVLSGDLEGNDVDVISYHGSKGENSYHVVTGSNTDANTIIDGFTIKAGYANGVLWQNESGGGMYNYNCSAEVMNCVFRRNISMHISSNHGGGGMYNDGGSPTISNSSFIENKADIGGAIFNAAFAKIENCLFLANISSNASGVFINHLVTTTFDNCIFADGDRGAAIELWNRSTCHVNNCIITNHPMGVEVFWSYLTISNSILWSNDSNILIRGVGEGGGEGIANVSYCGIQGGESNIIIDSYGTLNWLTGNISTDPNFVDPTNGDFHLQSQAGRYDPTTQAWIKDSITSPCIDAGDPTTSIGWEPYPNGGVVNMGAYGATVEASKSYFGTTTCETPIAGDINGDCTVDLIDFGIMSLHWLEDNNL